MHWVWRAVIAVEVGCGWLAVWLAAFDELPMRLAAWLDARGAGEPVIALVFHGSLAVPTAVLAVATYAVLTGIGGRSMRVRHPWWRRILRSILVARSAQRHTLIAGPSSSGPLPWEDAVMVGFDVVKDGVQIPQAEMSQWALPREVDPSDPADLDEVRL